MGATMGMAAKAATEMMVKAAMMAATEMTVKAATTGKMAMTATTGKTATREPMAKTTGMTQKRCTRQRLRNWQTVPESPSAMAPGKKSAMASLSGRAETAPFWKGDAPEAAIWPVCVPCSEAKHLNLFRLRPV